MSKYTVISADDVDDVYSSSNVLASSGHSRSRSGALEAPEEAAVVEGEVERLLGAISFAPRDLGTGAADTVRQRSEGRWRD